VLVLSLFAILFFSSLSILALLAAALSLTFQAYSIFSILAASFFATTNFLLSSKLLDVFVAYLGTLFGSFRSVVIRLSWWDACVLLYIDARDAAWGSYCVLFLLEQGERFTLLSSFVFR
jgi:hypothetical protein